MENNNQNDIIYKGYSMIWQHLSGWLGCITILIFITSLTKIKLPTYFGIDGIIVVSVAVSTAIIYFISIYATYKFKITHDTVEIFYFTRIFNRRKEYHNIKIDEISFNYLGDGAGIVFRFTFEGKKKAVECPLSWDNKKLKKKWEEMGLKVVEKGL